MVILKNAQKDTTLLNKPAMKNTPFYSFYSSTHEYFYEYEIIGNIPN